MDEGNVFLGCTTYDGTLNHHTARRIFASASKDPVVVMINETSLLASGFNFLLANALNVRQEEKIKWFALIHADIIPDPFWIDTLIEEAEKHNADLISAISPIKDERGLTSTAIGALQSDFDCFARLTVKQVKALPTTFDMPMLKEALTKGVLKALRIPITSDNHELLVNTGCMLLRIDKQWPGIHFTINDHIGINSNGKYIQLVEPEDWFLSRQIARLGGKVMATSKVAIRHVGRTYYNSQAIWGVNIDPVVHE